MTADRLDTIDVQLQGLLAVAQRQGQSIAELKDVSQQQAQTAERQGNQFDDRLDRIAVTVERQAETAERQSKTIETLVSAMAELSRTNAAMNLDRHALSILLVRRIFLVRPIFQ